MTRKRHVKTNLKKKKKKSKRECVRVRVIVRKSIGSVGCYKLFMGRDGKKPV